VARNIAAFNSLNEDAHNYKLPFNVHKYGNEYLDGT
jgi:hypothetical protein